MRIRKLLLATGAIVAAGTLALAPTASANTPTGTAINYIAVGNSTANVDHDIDLTMKSANVAITVYGFIPLNLSCTAGSAEGVVHGGPFTNPGMTIDALSLTCPSIFPDTEVTMEATCDIPIHFNPTVAENVHDGLVDTGTGAKFNRVTGTATTYGAQFNNCVTVSISNGCTFTIGGSSTVAFDEAVKTGGVQDLILSGNTVRINNVSNCAGAVSNNQTFTLNAVFNVDASGDIDFRTTALP